MDRQELKQELTQGSKWLRLVWMILFVIIFQLVELVLLLTAAVQFLLNLFTGRENERLRAFGTNLACYVDQLVRYLTFATDERPFPFNNWPQVDDEQDADPHNGN